MQQYAYRTAHKKFIYHIIVFNKNRSPILELNLSAYDLVMVHDFLRNRLTEYSYFEVYDIFDETIK